MNQRRVWVLCLSVVALVLTLYTLGVPLATSQGPFLRSRYFPGPLPTAPDAQEWKQASPLILALSGQGISEPLLLDPSVNSLSVRSLHNGETIAFVLEWSDATRNDYLAPGTFRDGAALAFPVEEAFAFSCMGRADSYLNIWHWKADWQADVDQAEADRKRHELPPQAHPPILRPRRVSSVEELLAGGLETMTSKRRQGFVQGRASREDQRWRVVFSRPINTNDPMPYASLDPGTVQSVSFAVWEGMVGEHGGQKAVGPWVRLMIEAVPEESSPREEKQDQSSGKSTVDVQEVRKSCDIKVQPGVVLTPMKQCQFDLLQRRCTEDDICLIQCMAKGEPQIGGGCFHVCFFSKVMAAWQRPKGWKACQEIREGRQSD